MVVDMKKVCRKCGYYTWSDFVDSCPVCGGQLVNEDEFGEGFDRMAVWEMDGGVYGF